MARRPCRRSEAGFALRLAGPLWRAALLVAIVNETIGVDRGEGHSLISRSAIPPPKQHEPLSLEEVANRGGSPVADELSAAVTREMQASALFAALTKWMDNEGLLGSTVSIHRAIATGRPSLAAWEVAPIFNGNEVKHSDRAPLRCPPHFTFLSTSLITFTGRGNSPKIAQRATSP